MEAEFYEKSAVSPSNVRTFHSLFDTAESDPKAPHLSLLEPVPKTLKVSTLGELIFSSKLQKKSRNIGYSLNRHFFLFPTHLGYAKGDNPTKMKKFVDLNGLKVIIDKDKSKNKEGDEGKYQITLFKSRSQAKLYTDQKELVEKWRNYLRRYCIMTNFGNYYTVKHLLGKGAHGKVVLATNIDENKDYAVKSFQKLHLIAGLKGFDCVINEINMLKRMDHTRVIKLYEIYESVASVYLVLDYAKGGELYGKLKQKKVYSENQCALIMKNILEGLAYIHEKGIIHRDIKPENIVLLSKDNDYDVKIVDFGFAMDENTTSEVKRCGTPGYVSPEVLSFKPGNKLTTKVDIFAVGALFYHMLTGSKLFSGSSVEEILKKNKQCHIDLFKLDARKVSPIARELLLNMLRKDPEERISAVEALQHQFFKNVLISTTDISEDNQDYSVGEVSRYSFDMTVLKELNMCSKSKIFDSAGTFQMLSHIPLDNERGSNEQINDEPVRPAYISIYHMEASPKSSYSHASSFVTSDSSIDSLEESKMEDKLSSPRSASSHYAHKYGKKSNGSNTPTTTSPFHKAAIMNNIRKSHMLELKPLDMSPRIENHSPSSFSDYLSKLNNPPESNSVGGKRNSIV